MFNITHVINQMVYEFIGSDYEQEECPNCKSKEIIQEHYYEEEYELKCAECGCSLNSSCV